MAHTLKEITKMQLQRFSKWSTETGKGLPDAADPPAPPKPAPTAVPAEKPMPAPTPAEIANATPTPEPVVPLEPAAEPSPSAADGEEGAPPTKQPSPVQRTTGRKNKPVQPLQLAPEDDFRRPRKR